MCLEKSVSKMGLRSLDAGRLTIKKHVKFDEIFDVRGCGFFEFSKIAIFGGLTIVSYTVFYALFHCGNEDFFSKKQMMVYDQITFFDETGPFFVAI